MTEDNTYYDLIVIGGGVNGAGIARDAAMRGLSVALFEKGDFCSGTSAWSSRLIHGGLRYLEYFEIPLVYESLNERRALQRIAGHLVRPIRIAIPVYHGARRGKALIRLGLLAYDLLSFRKSLPNHDMPGRSAALRAEPGLNPEGLKALARYYDAQITYAERLVLENVLDAERHGARVFNYSPVLGLLTENGSAAGVLYGQPGSDARAEIRGRAVVNAGGPWVDAVLERAGPQSREFIGGTKGSHIIVSRFDGCPSDAIYVEARSDGRPFFIIPWNGLVLIGTTDIRYEGDLDAVRASTDEVDYLLEECNHVFPRARLERSSVHFAYAGVRPLPKREEGPESAITRKHVIVENSATASGLYSIVGGKLTTYRNLAEQVVDRLKRDFDLHAGACLTAVEPLPGAHDTKTVQASVESARLLSAAGVERILKIYGSRAQELLEGIEARELPAGSLDDEGRVLAAEVVFAFTVEHAKNLVDVVHRRLMLGFDADQGRRYYASLIRVAAEHFSWDETRQARERSELERYADSFLVSGLPG
ncbi:MAG: glycerol-3-phosphate dehydrogenase [Pseudomonadota bacterium]